MGALEEPMGDWDAHQCTGRDTVGNGRANGGLGELWEALGEPRRH